VAQAIRPRGFPASRLNLGASVPPTFPPSVVVQVKALACEQGLVAEISGATLWRWLSADALRPWRHRSWIFPRDPDFAVKAGRILDLYDRVWHGRPLNHREFVISADEKSSIQARRRKQPTLAPAPGRSTRVEHEYFREGEWTYLAAWDVHRAKVFGRCEKKSGIAPVDRLIREVMSREPYKSARRVFWTVWWLPQRQERIVSTLQKQQQCLRPLVTDGLTKASKAATGPD